MAKLIRIEDLERNLHLWSLKEDQKLCELLESCKAEIIEGVNDVEQKLCAAATSVRELSSYVDNVAAKIATSSQTQFLQQAVADEEKHDSIVGIKEKKSQKIETAECISRAINRGMEDVRASSRDVEAVSSLPAYIGSPAPVQRLEETKNRIEEQTFAGSGDSEPAVGNNLRPSVSTQETAARSSPSVANSDFKRAFFDEDIFDSSPPLSEESTSQTAPVAKDLPSTSGSDFHDDVKPPKPSGSVEPVIFSASEISNRAKSLRPVAHAVQGGSRRPPTSSASEEIVKPSTFSASPKTDMHTPTLRNMEAPFFEPERASTTSRTLAAGEPATVSSVSEEEDEPSSIFEQIFKPVYSVSQRDAKPVLSSPADFIQEISKKSSMQKAESKIVKNSPAEGREVSASSILKDASSSYLSAGVSSAVNKPSKQQPPAADISEGTKRYTSEEATSSVSPSRAPLSSENMSAENPPVRQSTRGTQELPTVSSSSERLLSSQVAEKYKSIFADEDDEDDLFNIKPKKQPVEVTKAKIPSKLPNSNFAKLLGDKLARGPVQPQSSKPTDSAATKPVDSPTAAVDPVLKVTSSNVENKSDGGSYEPLPSLAKNRTRGPNRRPPSSRRPPSFASSNASNEPAVKVEAKEASGKDKEGRDSEAKNATAIKSAPKTISEPNVPKSTPKATSDSTVSKTAPKTTSESSMSKNTPLAAPESVLKSTPKMASESGVTRGATKTTAEPKHISTPVDEKRAAVNEAAEKQRKSSSTHETKQRSAVKSFFDADSDDGDEDVSVPSKTPEQTLKAETTSVAKHSSSVIKPASKITAKSLFSDDDDSDLSIFRKK